jgi:hypothetical protein
MVVLITLLPAIVGTSRAYGQEAPVDPAAAAFVAALREGDPAPFNGTLFSTVAAARLLADMELRAATCEVETVRRLSVLEADMQLRIDTELARNEALQYRYGHMIEIRDGQIEFLSARIRAPEWYEGGEFWFAVGAVVGIIVVVVSGYALSLVSN